MSEAAARGAVVLIENEQVALIERVREGRTYFLFPGGGVEDGESVEQAAVREAREELGLDVELGPLIALVTFGGRQQHYFRAYAVGGTLGTGDGAEFASPPDSPGGSYRPIWLPMRDLAHYDVRPQALAQAVCAGLATGEQAVLQIAE